MSRHLAIPHIHEEIERLQPWFHNLHLPGGIQTAPAHGFGDFPRWKWNQFASFVPADLRGWRALDIGCNAGFYSFELAGRGAEVTAIDHDAHYLAQARWAARQLDPHRRVRFEHRDAYSLIGCSQRFDLVLFLGVLYHLRYPMLVLDTIARLEPCLLVVQTLTTSNDEISGASRAPFSFKDRDRMNAVWWPTMAFIEGTFADDPTNWWVPNRACVHAMLRSAGFEVTAEPGHELFVCRGQRPRAGMSGHAQWDAAVAGARATRNGKGR